MPNCRQLQRVATHKPDVLFSILKQIQTDANVSLIEVSADDGGDDDIIAGSDDIIISEEESEPAGLVGPTAAELESCKELIQFDHIYHKPTSTSPQQGQMSEVVEVKIDPESESEAVAQNEVICSSQDISTPVTDNSYTDNALIDIDELLDLSSFNWDSMNNLDFEALTASSDNPDNITPFYYRIAHIEQDLGNVVVHVNTVRPLGAGVNTYFEIIILYMMILYLYFSL